MSKPGTGLQEPGLVQGPNVPKPEEIRKQLNALLASPAFHGSKRCQQFLHYVCEKSLAGEGGTLKERTLAIEVFGRQPQSDLGEDTIVRVGAREVRKRLAQYYVSPDGAAAEIRIDLPSGSYAPEFRYAASAAEEPPAATPAPAVPAPIAAPPAQRSIWLNRRVLAGGAILLVMAAVASVLLLRRTGPDEAAFRSFWNPVFQSSDPLLIAVAHPLVYHPSGRALKLSEENLPHQEIPTQRPLSVAPRLLDGSDLVPVFNQYVGFGDMVAANEVTAMLARRKKDVRLRLASGVEFPDLRQAPTLLIGAITNRWTMQLQQAWRFRFQWTPGTRNLILDTQAPPNGETQWTIPAKDDGSAQEDYILLCRIRNSLTGGMIIATAGLKQFGTEAGGRLLGDPAQLAAILRRLPAGWESKNVQFVLRAKVINNAAAQPDVVAFHVW